MHHLHHHHLSFFLSFFLLASSKDCKILPLPTAARFISSTAKTPENPKTLKFFDRLEFIISSGNWMNELMTEWMDACMHGWMDG
jgi:hypothetical protein